MRIIKLAFIMLLVFTGKLLSQELPVEEAVDIPDIPVEIENTNPDSSVSQFVTQNRGPLGQIIQSAITQSGNINASAQSTGLDTADGEQASQTEKNSPGGFFVSVREMFEKRTPIARLIFSAGIILFLWLLRFFLLRIVFRNTEKASLRYRWRKISSYVALGLGIILVSQIWIEQFDSILTYLGLVSAGIAIALKDFFINLLGWIFIIWIKPFEVGDRIELEEESIAGDVIDIRAFQFVILEIGNWVDADQSTGRILHIPNGKIFNQSIANYSKAFEYIWNEISTVVTFQSDWKRAKEVLLEIVRKKSEGIITHVKRKVKEASRRFMISYTELTPIVYVRVKDSGVELTVRYLCDPKKRRSTEHDLWENILDSFAIEPNVEFAYTTYTIHGADQPSENNSGKRNSKQS